MTRIRRINPRSLAKTQALIFLAVGIINAIFSILTIFTTNLRFPNAPSPIGFILVSIILMPIFYTVMGFIFGLLEAGIYNIVSKRTGGIEIETESM